MTDIDVPDWVHSCNTCGAVKDKALFSRDYRRKNGLSRRCLDCTRAEAHRYTKTEAYRIRYAIRERERAASGVKRVRKNRPKPPPRDPIKVSAARKFQTAVRNGTLVRPPSCSQCGASGLIHGHHHDYAKPLDVIWLCQRCHMREHRKYPDTLRQEKPE